MADPRLRQIKIRTGVLKRISKEKSVYEKEVITEKNRLEKFKNEGADSHVLAKQQEVIEECMMMIPDSLRRLNKESKAFKKFLEDESELKETQEYTDAKEILNEVDTILKIGYQE